MKVEDRPLEKLALEDTTFDLGFGRGYEALRRSMAEIGVLQPLVVRQLPGGEADQQERLSGCRWQVVCGFGRARAASDLRPAQLPLRILPAEISDADCLRLALFDNLGHRCFNAIERALILAKLAPHVGRDHLIRDYMPLLGLSPSATVLDHLLALLNLIEPLKRAVAGERIEPNTAMPLAALPPDDQAAFARLLERCRPSVSIVREWVEMLLDLSRRDRVGVAEILTLPELAGILESDETTAAERTAALRRHLQRMRYPVVSRGEEQFDQAHRALRLPPTMRLEPSAGFESDQLRLEIRFENEKELRLAAERITSWFDDPSLLERLWPARRKV